ncbi:tetratricopeptide repeat protein [Pseudomonas sp. SDO528_S397]
MIKEIFIGGLLYIFCLHAVSAQLSPEQQAAKDRGIALYNQSDWYDSQPLLKDAAEAGDSLAQYYLGEAIRKSNRYTSATAKRWYEAAAKQGDLYAMLRLADKNDFCSVIGTCTEKTSKEWRKEVLKTAIDRSKINDVQAMLVLYLAGEGLDWLEKAAQAGDGYAQSLLAGLYKDGRGWFLIPGSRKKAVEKWFKASAESGYPLGMFLYANFLYENNGNKQDIEYWVRKSAEGGYVIAISNYALSLAHLPDDFGYPLDLIKAYGLAYLLSKLQGGGTAPEDGQRILLMIAEKMSPEDISRGKIFAREWKEKSPPLSYFEPIYGY